MQYYKFDKINIIMAQKNITLTNGTPKFKKKIDGNVLSLLSVEQQKIILPTGLVI